MDLLDGGRVVIAMRTPDLELLENVLSSLEEILTTHSQITENLFSVTQTQSSQDKIEDLRKRIEDERTKVKKIKDSQKRKQELEKLRRDQDKGHDEESKQNESKGVASTYPLLDGKGKVVGYIQSLGKGRVNILNAKGKVVAREIDARTFDGRGRFQGRGNQGLRLLGLRQKK